LTIGVILAAAGRGARLGSPLPKALLALGGRSLLERSIAAFLAHPLVGPLVATVPDPDRFARALGPFDPRVRLVAGGAERQDSVRAGLAALAAIGDTDLVLVHDAARPLVDQGLITAVADAAARHGAAIPALPVPDTVKRVGEGGLVLETVPRADLVLVQTPQGFSTAILRRAHAEAARAGYHGTDDAALVERLGLPVAVVPGSARNIKITSPGDVTLAEALLASLKGDDHA
jgi:2-C-methyl-D-erythritol 4-phosphate cytidylyltransferase